MELNLYYPFDAIVNGNKTQDYTRHGFNAAVTGATLTAGKILKGLRFEQPSDLVQLDAFVNFASDFTLTCYIKLNNANNVTVAFLLDSTVINSKTISFSSDWHFLAITKTAQSISYYLDFALLESQTITGLFNNFQINTDANSYILDDFRIYDFKMSDLEIQSIYVAKDIGYSIDSKDFSSFGVYVEASSGLFDLPKMKEPQKIDWSDYHGTVIDLATPRYESREITLKCWMRAETAEILIDRFNAFCDIFKKAGTKRLKIDVIEYKPLIYEVYCNNDISIDKKWRQGEMFGRFTLKLIEPEPFKIVIKKNQSAANINISCDSEKSLMIYWGDGKTSEVYGQINIAHTYTGRPYEEQYALVYGVIEDIENFVTDGTIIWDR
ncbi:MAG: phage tail family protein [Prevotellaceae bacterium]|jgi:hypothetical protein|nr:phage tail family protein [Prevotellaceae bacterium]